MITTRHFSWSWQGREVGLGLDEAGEGPLVVLLPALSSISSRGEMRPLMERLARDFRVVAVDWPGFGTQPRPPMHWTPDALSAFVQYLFQSLITEPVPRVVAAGHAATYVLHTRLVIPVRWIVSFSSLRLGEGRCRPWPAAIVRSSPRSGAPSRRL